MKISLPPVLLAAGIPTILTASETGFSEEQIAFFEKRVRPVLVEHCYECHSAEANKSKGGLRVDTREALRLGGDSGEAVVPGNPEKSLLVIAIRHADEDLKMPEKEKLSEVQISDLTRWVEMGAPDPREEDSEAASIIVREIDYEKGGAFWSFRPPVKRPAPEVRDESWPRSTIDRHLLASMEAEGLKPVADADRRTLVRRIYFDLTGLPPGPGQVQSFLADRSDKAVENLVNELLASPHFGEYWGRHWLDVVRYSESNGMERNFTYPHAWRYRDYVIASFNRDKPFDQFVREQIAGDLLEASEAPGTTAEERRIATGFLAIGPKQLNERDKEVFRMELIDEQIDASTRAVLGLTASCARCHDHKFDPIGMEDYYALAGIFESTRTLYGTKSGGGNRQASGLTPIGEDAEKREQALREHTQRVADEQKLLSRSQKQVSNLKRDLARTDDDTKAVEMEARMEEMRDKVEELRGLVSDLRKNAPPPPDYAMGAADAEAPRNAKIRLRGDAKKHGKEVPRGYLRVMRVASAPAPAADASGRREFAEWLTTRDNPLPARVMVNRIWHHLFGTGLVRTVDNFGKMGERPVNQELLDHLALQFIEDGWSVKSMIRRIMLTRAYGLSGSHDLANHTTDPENRRQWKMSRRRLGAESIRDAMLLSSGQLKLETFQGSVLQEIGNVNYGRTQLKTGEKAKAVASHRSVYLPIIRNAVPEALRVFDFAEPSLIVGNRPVTNVPTQSLYLLNDPFVLEQSDLLAGRLLETPAIDDERRAEQAYLWTLSRPPEPSERARAIQLVDDVREEVESGDPARDDRIAWAALGQALMGSAEFRYID